MTPLIELTQVNRIFTWSSSATKAFNNSKQNIHICSYFGSCRPSKLLILEIDASNFALGMVLSQAKENRCVRPITFYSWKFEAVEIDYEVHDGNSTDYGLF
jgi:hypothetical protein